MVLFGRSAGNPSIDIAALSVFCDAAGIEHEDFGVNAQELSLARSVVGKDKEQPSELVISEAVPPVRDADGQIDVAGTMQTITTVIENWIREHPEQWLWQHRRWR